MQIIEDCRTAIKSPPQSAVEQRVLYSRLRAYWSRCEYTLWNSIAVGLLYLFNDSLLNQYIKENKTYLNIIFHFIQLIAFIAYFITSLKDPGYVKFIDENTNELDHDEENVMLNILNNEDNNDNDINYDDDMDIDINVRSSIPKYIEILNNEEYDDDIVTETNENKQQLIANSEENNSEYRLPYNLIDYIPYYNRNIIIDKDASESTWPTNYCEQCNFIRPIRSKHCFFCGRCIAKFDHHCPLVGNCVGGGNYKYFITFLFFQSIIILWTFYMSLNTLFVISLDDITNFTNNHKHHYRHSIIGWIFRIIFFVVMFMFLFSIIGLMGFHIYLLFTNQTTMELMRPDYIDKYLFEETKRKKQYDKKHQKNDEKRKENNQIQKPNNNEVNIDDDVNDDDKSYYYKFYGNVTSYHTYFDQGFITNIYMVFNGILQHEWVTPLKCNIRNAE